MKTIGEIKEEFSAAREADWNAICQMYETDLRSGVQKLVQQYRKKLDALEKEKLRMEQMMQFEHKYEHLGYLCGIDEVGRGPLAGPVVACAVILPKDHSILYLNDSKKLTAHKREELYDVIMREAVAVGLGMASPARISGWSFFLSGLYGKCQRCSARPVYDDFIDGDDESFWRGCEGCINVDVLHRTNRKYCICTAMLFKCITFAW